MVDAQCTILDCLERASARCQAGQCEKTDRHFGALR
jgi:hypothetical protein